MKIWLLINKHIQYLKSIGIIADSSARAFIKCIKSPDEFYMCEKCIVTGIT